MRENKKGLATPLIVIVCRANCLAEPTVEAQEIGLAS
jgi:hypothetical protein